MSENNIKSWERPWTTQEMIDNSSNWSLAGDAGLLKYLEEFSDKLLKRAIETNDKLEELESNVNEASISLANVHNEFMGLHNTQFIESRVYEDDETLPTPVSVEKEVKPKHSDAEKIEEIKKVIFDGLQITDEFYEKVEIQDSDSEDDIDEPSVVFQPIEKYTDRPLPYIIGTNEWHKHWHVGLIESSSESETENQNEEFSESDSDQEISNFPIRNRLQIPGISDSNSESDVTRDNQSIRKEPTLFNNNTDMFESSDSDTESIGSKPTETSKFAAELAAKLGKVEASSVINDNEVNKKPIKKQPNFGDLFSDEPPPLDKEDDISNPIKTGLFSGGQGLFDDDEDEADNFWNPNISIPKPKKTTKQKPKDDIFANENNDDIFDKKEEIHKPSIDTKPKKILSGGLFDDDDSDLFSTKPAKSEPLKPSLFSDEPPEINDQNTTSKTNLKKQPVGIKSLFGDNKSLLSEVAQAVKHKDKDLQKNELEKTRETKTAPKEENNSSIPKPKQEEPPKIVVKKKVINLFDDEPLFNNDIFSSGSNNKTNLFDDNVQTDLFGDKKVIEHRPTSLFGDENSTQVQNSTNNKKTVSLFSPDSPIDDVFGETKHKTSLFDSLEKQNTDNNVEQKTGIVKKAKNKPLSLFSDEEDNISSSENKSELLVASTPKKVESIKKKPKQISLFSSEEEEDAETKDKEETSKLVLSKVTEDKVKEDPLFASESVGTKKSKPISLFDDTEDISIPSEKSKISDKSAETIEPPISTNEAAENQPDPLFNPNMSASKKKVNTIPISLFSSEEEEEDIFKITTNKSNQTPQKVDLFTENKPLSTENKQNETVQTEIITNITESVQEIARNEADLFSSEKQTIEQKTSDPNSYTPEMPETDIFSNTSVSKPEIIEPKPIKNEPISLFSSEPPPLDDVNPENPSTILSSDVENDLFSNVISSSKDINKSDDNSSNNTDFESDILVGNQSTINRKLSDGRLDLFSDNYSPKIESEVNKGGLFDWVPPELDQPPPLKASNEKLDEKKTSSGLFSDEEDDLFSSTTNTSYNKNTSWLDEEPPPLDDAINKKKETKLSLFGDDDLFETNNVFKKNQSTNKVVEPNKIDNDNQKSHDIEEKPEFEIGKNNKTEVQQNISKHPLFENEDNSRLFTGDKNLEDDIFSSSTSTKPKITPSDTLTKKVLKSDPLMGDNDLFKSHKIISKSGNKNEILTDKNINKDPLLSKSDNLFSKVEKPKKSLVVPEKKNKGIMKKDEKLSKAPTSLFSDEEEVLTEKPLKKVVPKSKSLFSEDSDEDLFSNSSSNNSNTKPKVNDNQKASSKGTGKIKHNLNINVAALLPGAAPKRSKENLPEEKSESGKSTEDVKSPTNSNMFPESPMENVDILISAAKQRVRIPTKRRPSTRKARHEAIRKSGIDFSIDGEIPESKDILEDVQKVETEKNIQNAVNNNPSDNTANNIFNTDNVKKSNAKHNIQKIDTLFDDSESLFKTKNKLPVEKKYLFDDDDEDDDIFNSAISKPTVTNTGSSSQANKKPSSRIKKLTAHSQDINDPLDVINK